MVRDPTAHVPQAFCTLIEMTLSKMVATNVLEPEFNSPDFWKAFARKFTSAQSYDSRKRKKDEAPTPSKSPEPNKVLNYS